MLSNYNDALLIFFCLHLLLSHILPLRVNEKHLLSTYSTEKQPSSTQELYVHFLNCIIQIVILPPF